MHSRLVGGAAVAIGVAVGIWGCGGGSSYSSTPTNPTPSTPAPSANTVTVTIVSSSGSKAYNPNPVQANTGDTIAFKNSDTTTHHVVMDDGSADLGNISPGSTQTMTLKGTGGNFHCTIHSSMVGSINGNIPEPPPCNNPGYC